MHGQKKQNMYWSWRLQIYPNLHILIKASYWFLTSEKFGLIYFSVYWNFWFKQIFNSICIISIFHQIDDKLEVNSGLKSYVLFFAEGTTPWFKCGSSVMWLACFPLQLGRRSSNECVKQTGKCILALLLKWPICKITLTCTNIYRLYQPSWSCNL